MGRHIQPRSVEPEVDRPDFWGCNSIWWSQESLDWDWPYRFVENWDGSDDQVLDNIPLWDNVLR